MMRLLLLSALLALSACGRAVTPAPALGAPTSKTVPALGVRATVPGHGLSARFPGKPTVSTSRSALGPLAELTYVNKAAQNYGLAALSTAGKDRQTDSKWFETVRSSLKLEKRADFELRSFRGVELSGVYKGRQSLVRLLAVGDTLFTAVVDAEPGKLDEDAARRFLASLDFELPWRIYGSTTTGFSVMVPAHAIELDRTDLLNAEDRAVTRVFYVGGRYNLAYLASAQEIATRNSDVSDEQVLDTMIEVGMRDKGWEVTFQGPIEVSGMRGREFLTRKDGETLRGRALIGARAIYMLVVSAKDEPGASDVETSKFYDSLVCY